MGAIAIAMPRLGMTMEEGTVVEWPLPVGARVEKGQVVLVIETEKAESEIEATAAGTLRHLFAAPGETLPCGALLAALTEDPEEAFDPDAFRRAWTPPEAAGPAAPAAPPRGPVPGRRKPGTGRKPVAPAARALARRLAVDPERVPGSGPGGRVTKQDVELFAAARDRRVAVEPGVELEVLREGPESGEGGTVVLLPGLGSDVSAFALLAPGLRERWSLVGVNPRGVAGSDAPEAELYPVARAAEDVAAVLADEAPAHVVGASLGAAVALELALSHPERVRSLVLITPFVVASPRLLAFADAWARIADEASAETVAAFLAPWLFADALLSDPARRDRTLRGLVQSLRRIPAATLARSAAGIRAWSGTRRSELARIRVPVLVLAAEDDLLTPGSEHIADLLPDASAVTIEAAGHALAVDAPEELLGPLRAHLGRHASE